MSAKCKAYSKSKLGLKPDNNKLAFYAGWDAARQAKAQPAPDVRELVEALRGFEIIDEHLESEGCVWLLLRSDGKKIGAGSIRVDGELGKAFALYAEKRKAALAKWGGV